MTDKTVVVIGHGMVGHRFVQSLREKDITDQWQVVILAEEVRPAYDRVALTSYTTHWDASQLALQDNEFDGDAAVTLRLGDAVADIDTATKTVTTESGFTQHYDALVLATGSVPFVPPVPGHDLEHCFVYRTIEDLDAIKASAEKANVEHGEDAAAIVVGGGLLGLEAANALRSMNLRPRIVEFAPRLMPLQVDAGGGSLLRGLVEDLGLAVHTGVGANGIVEVDGRYAVKLSDDSELTTDLVVFSAGVRPRDHLARAAGIPVGERGGIVVDANCQTEIPGVYAIGECALASGRVYGLVAPGYTQAEVAADSLVGSVSTFDGADMSTKLKLLGVDVASFGDAHGATAQSKQVVVDDPIKGIYKKLVVSVDAEGKSTLLGGILIGDAADYGTLRPMVGNELPVHPLELISPVSSGGAAIGAAALPDDAQICSCNAVTKGAINDCIADGHSDVPGIKACTRAGTTCGSCVPMLQQLLKASGVEQSTVLCEHFALSRQELFTVVKVAGITTFDELVDKHGTGRGCEICKPAVASILASLGNGHILTNGQAKLQDTNDKFLANLQRNGTYSVVPRIPGGEITPEKLIVIGEVAKEFGLYTKITGGQRIDMFGATVDQLPLIWQRLVDAGMESGHAYGKALRTVKSCVGSDWCRFGVQDSVGLAVELELRYRGLRSPHKLKSAVSGCARECAEARGKDFGVIATEKGWNLYVGGNGGTMPRHADLLIQDVDKETLIRTIDRFVMYYVRTADRLQRTSLWLENIEGGLDQLRRVIVDDALGLCAELDRQMAAHVENYSDEWADVLADQEKLSRFVSFVNAPGTPDPTISFRSEREQKVPVLLQIGGLSK